MDIINRRVSFRISDVSIPPAPQVLMELYGEEIVEGRAIDTSDCGPVEGAYAVVEVEGVKQPLVVAVEKIIAVA